MTAIKAVTRRSQRRRIPMPPGVSTGESPHSSCSCSSLDLGLSLTEQSKNWGSNKAGLAYTDRYRSCLSCRLLPQGGDNCSPWPMYLDRRQTPTFDNRYFLHAICRGFLWSNIQIVASLDKLFALSTDPTAFFSRDLFKGAKVALLLSLLVWYEYVLEKKGDIAHHY
jgi:hypothetical protein